MNLYLKIASIINFIVGGLFVLIGLPGDVPFLLGYGLFELGIGFVYYQANKLEIEELYNKRIWLLSLAIINLLPNFLSSIFIFITYDEIKREYQKNKKKKTTKKQKIDNEKRNLDILLKVGVGLILLSGVIFMNSSMFMISPWFKMLFLFLLYLLFYALYVFSDKYLKIKNTVRGYYLLSMFFLLLTYYSFKDLTIFGSWLQQEGFNFFMMSVYAVLTAICYYSHKKFQDHFYLVGSYLGGFLTLWSFLTTMNIPTETMLVCVNLIILLLSLLEITNKREKKLFMNFLLIATYALTIAYVDINILKDSIMCIFAGMLLLGNMYLLTVSNKDLWSSILTTMFSVMVLPTMVYLLNLPIQIQVWVLTLSYCLIFGVLLLNKYTIKNVLFYNLTTLVLNLSLFGVYVYSYEVNTAMALFVSFAMLFMHFMYLTVFDSKKTIEYYLQPVKTGILAYTCLMLLKPIFLLDEAIIFSVVSMLLLLPVHVRLENELKWDYFITYFISLIIAFGFAMGGSFKIGSLIVILLSTYTSIFTYHSKDKRIRQLYPLSYGWTLLMIYELIIGQNVFGYPVVMSDIVVLLSFLVGVVANYEDKKMRVASMIALLVPVYHLFTDLVPGYLAEEMFTNLFVIGLIMFFCEKGVKREKDRNLFSAITIAFCLISVVFESHWMMGIYIGLVTLSLMYFATYRNQYQYLFNVSLVFFILNILVHLSSIWLKIPFWTYLLIAGTVTIGLVTYKEINREKRK